MSYAKVIIPATKETQYSTEKLSHTENTKFIQSDFPTKIQAVKKEFWMLEAGQLNIASQQMRHGN